MTDISLSVMYDSLVSGRRNFSFNFDEIEELAWLGVVDYVLQWKAASGCYESVVTTFRPNPKPDFSSYRHLRLFSYSASAEKYEQAKEIVKTHCRMLQPIRIEGG